MGALCWLQVLSFQLRHENYLKTAASTAEFLSDCDASLAHLPEGRGVSAALPAGGFGSDSLRELGMPFFLLKQTRRQMFAAGQIYI